MPVESMKVTSVRSTTTARFPSSANPKKRLPSFGAVIASISPGSDTTWVVSSTALSTNPKSITPRKQSGRLPAAGCQFRWVGTGELGRLTRAGAGTSGSWSRRRSTPGRREWSRTLPRPSFQEPSGSLMPPPPGPSRPGRGSGPSPPPPSSPRESSSSSRSRKNQISHTTSRPTSKTRKPTMKIHPSVVTRSMLPRWRSLLKGKFLVGGLVRHVVARYVRDAVELARALMMSAPELGDLAQVLHGELTQALWRLAAALRSRRPPPVVVSLVQSEQRRPGTDGETDPVALLHGDRPVEDKRGLGPEVRIECETVGLVDQSVFEARLSRGAAPQHGNASGGRRAEVVVEVVD